MGFPWDVLYSATLRILRNSLSGRWSGQTTHNMATAFNSVAAVRGAVAILCWLSKLQNAPTVLRVVRTDRSQLSELQCRTHAVTSVIYSAMCMGEVTVVLDTQQTGDSCVGHTANM
jgi:hypothetical protein